MQKPARLNANALNSQHLRKIQSEYRAKFKPAKLSIESIADLAMELGMHLARKKLNLDK